MSLRSHLRFHEPKHFAVLDDGETVSPKQRLYSPRYHCTSRSHKMTYKCKTLPRYSNFATECICIAASEQIPARLGVSNIKQNRLNSKKDFEKSSQSGYHTFKILYTGISQYVHNKIVHIRILLLVKNTSCLSVLSEFEYKGTKTH